MGTYTMVITQPTAFSLSTVFSKSFRSVGIMFTKHYFGFGAPKPLGVGHGDDLGYIFPMSPPGSIFPPMVVTPEQQRTRQALVDTLASFARTGKPSINGSGQWESLDP